MSESKQRSVAGETKVIMSNRKGYACLDIGSMGVDLKENFEWVQLRGCFSFYSALFKSHAIAMTFHRKSKILNDTNQYPDNKLLSEQQQQQPMSENGEKSDESSEKYVIDKPEGDEKKEYDEEDGKRDDSEKVIRTDKKILGEKLPPGWEKHEG